ncbi:MAG: cytochrome c biogenesis protein CcsA [Verrucomicrobiae bacterium]|nr:cytochrome c biogenesis protein CcsA [Verrucomicrobiae bacterium]
MTISSRGISASSSMSPSASENAVRRGTPNASFTPISSPRIIDRMRSREPRIDNSSLISSAISFAALAIALFLEARYRTRGFLLGATPLAAAVLLLADLLPTTLDSSLHPLVPVLRSNFWLAAHVITITTSYASFALALALAHGVLWRAIRTRRRSGDDALHGYVDRALQIGVLLLAAGTILGGVWANYSWGRFWGWDPKETWALIALIVYLFFLHGRLARWWAGFGMAVGAILGFQSVIMAWYGVNFVLGVGLHSYGFGSGGVHWAILFLAVECAFVAFAAWRSRPARA